MDFSYNNAARRTQRLKDLADNAERQTEQGGAPTNSCCETGD